MERTEGQSCPETRNPATLGEVNGADLKTAGQAISGQVEAYISSDAISRSICDQDMQGHQRARPGTATADWNHKTGFKHRTLSGTSITDQTALVAVPDYAKPASSLRRLSGKHRDAARWFEKRGVNFGYVVEQRSPSAVPYPVVFARVRLNEIETVIRQIHRGAVDANKADAMSVFIMALPCLLAIPASTFGADRTVLSDPIGRIVGWANRFTPALFEDGGVDLRFWDKIADDFSRSPRRFSADTVAKSLHVSKDQRSALGLKTIGAYNQTKAERDELAKQRDAERHRLARIEAGATPREQSASRLKPWLEDGFNCRRTWERHGKKPRVANPSPVLNIEDSGSRTDLRHADPAVETMAHLNVVEVVEACEMPVQVVPDVALAEAEPSPLRKPDLDAVRSSTILVQTPAPLARQDHLPVPLILAGYTPSVWHGLTAGRSLLMEPSR